MELVRKRLLLHHSVTCCSDGSLLQGGSSFGSGSPWIRWNAREAPIVQGGEILPPSVLTKGVTGGHQMGPCGLHTTCSEAPLVLREIRGQEKDLYTSTRRGGSCGMPLPFERSGMCDPGPPGNLLPSCRGSGHPMGHFGQGQWDRLPLGWPRSPKTGVRGTLSTS